MNCVLPNHAQLDKNYRLLATSASNDNILNIGLTVCISKTIMSATTVNKAHLAVFKPN